MKMHRMDKNQTENVVNDSDGTGVFSIFACNRLNTEKYTLGGQAYLNHA